jgi:16S rRNA (guanine527-N7)-methyltransferase
LIEALLQRYGLPAAAGRQFEVLVDCVASDPAAPTSVTDPAGIARDHLADSLVALELPEVRAARAVADLGSGAGFPGLALAIALPGARVRLVESNGRKCAFITRTAETCGVGNAEVVHARAEEWAAGLGSCDLVTARAVAPLAVVAEYAAPLLRDGGTLLAWRGRRDPDDEVSAVAAAAALGLDPAEPLQVQPYPEALHRHLHAMVKARATPERFPRRPGVARKRPLG